MSSRRIAQHFDVAVLGNATGGLVAAALLAKAGLRVVIIAAAPPAPPTWRHPVYLPSQATAVRRVLERLGLLWARHPSARRPSPRQIILPERRLDIPYGQQNTLAALAAEWPHMRGPLEAFFERLQRFNELCERVVSDESRLLHPQGIDHITMPFRLRRSRRFAAPLDAIILDTLFGGIQSGHVLRDVLTTPLAGLTQRGTFISYFAAIRALHRFWCEEPWTLGEGHAPLSALWDAALMHNGQFWPQAVSTLHMTKKHRIGDIAVADSNQVASAQMVLWNWGRGERVPDVLDEAESPIGRADPSVEGQTVSAPPTFAIYGDSSRVPVGLASQASVRAGRQTTRIWRITRPAPPLEGEIERVVLVARAYGHTAVDGLPNELRAIVSEAAPYLADSCRIARLPGDPDAPPPPWNARISDAGLLGIQPLRMRTPYRNMLCTQDGVTPVLGIEGAFWVGWRAAEEFERRLRPRRPVLKRWQPRLGSAL